MADQLQGQIGEWVTPTGEKVPVLQPQISTHVNWSITALVDGQILPMDLAFATLHAQRDYWWRLAEERGSKLADALARLQQGGAGG